MIAARAVNVVKPTVQLRLAPARLVAGPALPARTVVSTGDG
jgi:hypothetical protein